MDDSPDRDGLSGERRRGHAESRNGGSVGGIYTDGGRPDSRPVGAGSPFLWVDEVPSRASRVRSGRILVSPAAPHIPKRVPSGLIHDWIGAAFIPNATINVALPVLRDYGRYKEIYRPNAADSRTVAKGLAEDRFSMVLMNKVFFSKTALDIDYRASYARLDDRRMYSVFQTTRIQEIAGYGTASLRALPESEGIGLI